MLDWVKIDYNDAIIYFKDVGDGKVEATVIKPHRVTRDYPPTHSVADQINTYTQGFLEDCYNRKPDD